MNNDNSIEEYEKVINKLNNLEKCTSTIINSLSIQEKNFSCLLDNTLKFERKFLNAPLSKEYYTMCTNEFNAIKANCVSNLYKCNQSKMIMLQNQIQIKNFKITYNNTLLKKISLKRTMLYSKYIPLGMALAVCLFNIGNTVNNYNYYGSSVLIKNLMLGGIITFMIKYNLDRDNFYHPVLNNLEKRIKLEIK